MVSFIQMTFYNFTTDNIWHTMPDAKYPTFGFSKYPI